MSSSIAEAMGEWVANSNDATHISLVDSEKTLATFHPKFTYPIFGEEESIFGYQGLKIHLKYHASDMRPVVQITYSKKFKAVENVEPTDVKAALEEFLPKIAFEKISAFETAIKEFSNTSWTPPGVLYTSFAGNGDESFEIWKGSLADPVVKQMVKRIQIMVPFFIEGGVLLDLEDTEENLDRWTIFFMYKKNPAGKYEFVGYSTVYRYFLYQPVAHIQNGTAKRQRINKEAYLDFQLPLPEVSFSSLPCRSRISQFIILPPYHGGGNGSRFYNAIYEHYLADPSTIEITVEDPNEAFDDLRDVNDLARLRTLPTFTGLRINRSATPKNYGTMLDSKTLEIIRTSLKMAPRQFYRVVEMQLLSLIPAGVRQSLLAEEEKKKKDVEDLQGSKHEYHLWQLWTKKRLYKHNREMLMQVDRTERIDKLESALGAVEADYGRLLRALESRNGDKSERATTGGKRPAEDEDNEDEPGAKKVRTA